MNIVMKRFIVERLDSDFLNMTTYRDVFKYGYDKKKEEAILFINKMTEKYGEEAIDNFSDEYSQIEDTNKLFNNLCIIALYMDLEMCLKEIAVYLFDEEKRNLYKFENIKKTYKKNKINITSISTYFIINEIRELNNCIKHNGYVSKKLAGINKKWNMNHEIVISEEIIEFYEKSILKFKSDLHYLLHESLKK